MIYVVDVGSVLLAAAALASIPLAFLTLRYRSTIRAAERSLAGALSRASYGPGVAESSEFGVLVDQACHSLEALGHRIEHRHPVTGLDTRETLLSALAESLDGALVLGVITLTDFDSLASYDADAADHVLSEIAQRLVRLTPTHCLLAQVDRASFAILFKVDVGNAVVQEMEALCYALRDRVLTSGVEYLPQIRHGHVGLSAPVSKPVNALTRAMASVHGKTIEASGAPTSAGAVAFALEQDLRQAVQKHQLELWYQPVVDAETGTLCSVEALTRWRHPVRGMVSPAQFIPAMEKIGLSEEIGNWVLDRAARDAVAWTRSGLDNVKVAVNLSAHQLVRPDLDIVIERLIARHGLPPEMLELELTETAATVDQEAARALFGKLRARGIKIVIDDFGAGYASLSYLKRLEFDKLKIDREFVSNVDTNRQAQAICHSIIALAAGLDLAVLVEGIERREEFEWFRTQGCHLFQGYYFAKPLTYDELLSFGEAPDLIHEKCAPRDAKRRRRLGVLAA
jgi:EAL domain-containing protein (putative c-di-GMP-specific phosphodiesterase class I)